MLWTVQVKPTAYIATMRILRCFSSDDSFDCMLCSTQYSLS